VGLSHFFEQILGYPKDGSRKKADNLRLIAQLEGIYPEDLFHVGDSLSDKEAAQVVGCFFFGIANDDNRWVPEQESFAVVHSLRDLQASLNTVL
jgi:phosphoglycolate phosphatase-like HAD superfamily hydrolase